MLSGVVGLALGDQHSMILKEDGSVWGTGKNSDGQIGDGSRTSRANFVKVIPSDGQAVAAGKDHSMVLKQDGSVWATGVNDLGQLGDGSDTDKKYFASVAQAGNGA